MNFSLIANAVEFDSAMATECFGSFLSFVSLSPEDYKHQLNHFLYPVYVHLYLESIAQGAKLRALEFYEHFSSVFISTAGYKEAMEELLKVQSEGDVSTHPYFKLFRSSKFKVKLSNDCFNYFLDFLKNDTTDILIRLINLYFAVTIVQSDDDESLVKRIMRFEDKETESKPNKGSDSKDGAEAGTSSTHDTEKLMMDEHGLVHSRNENLQAVDEYSHLNVVLSNSDDDDETSVTTKSNLTNKSLNAKKSKKFRVNSDRQKETGESSDGMSQSSVTQKKKYTRCSSSKGAGEISKSCDPKCVKQTESKEDASRKLAALKAASDKVSKLPQPVPFLCSYDINCEAGRSLCDVKISWDDAKMASAFDDSSIELRSLIPTPLHVDHKNGDVSSVQLHHVDKPPKTCSLENMQVLRGHSAEVYGLSFNRHSSILLSCSGDTTIRAWDMGTCKNVAIYRGHNYPVLDVDYDLFSFHFASCSIDSTCRLWDTERTFPLAMLVGHQSSARCIKFHPNGKYLATGSADKSIILWHSQQFRQVRIYHGHKAQILTLAFSPDGKYLASASVDKTIKIWDIAAGKLICDLQEQQSNVYSLCFNGNTSLLASGGLEKDIKIWNMEECIADYKSKEATKADSYFLSSIATQCSTVRFVRFSRKNLLTSVGFSPK